MLQSCVLKQLSPSPSRKLHNRAMDTLRKKILLLKHKFIALPDVHQPIITEINYLGVRNGFFWVVVAKTTGASLGMLRKIKQKATKWTTIPRNTTEVRLKRLFLHNNPKKPPPVEREHLCNCSNFHKTLVTVN